jgi:ribosomal protein S18 acetylase RimI-like enzyme
MQPEFPPTIRRARVEDIDAIEAIEKRCFHGQIAYSKRQLSYLCFYSNNSCLLDTKENTIRGFIIITYRQDTAVAGIETVDVDPNFKKQGIGLKLLVAADIDMKQHGTKTAQLEVSEGNRAAIRLYEKAGYIETERIKDYYKYDHEGTRNAIRMVKAL